MKDSLEILVTYDKSTVGPDTVMVRADVARNQAITIARALFGGLYLVYLKEVKVGSMSDAVVQQYGTRCHLLAITDKPLREQDDG